MIIQFFILPMIMFLKNGVTDSILYSFISLICIIFYICIAYFLKNGNRLENIFKIFYLMTLIYIVISVLKNPTSVNIYDIKNNLFNIDKRLNREMYGFVAPNAFAILSITNILLGFYLSSIVYRKEYLKKLLINLSIILNIVLIITTASRGALISLIVFFLIFFYNKILNNKFHKLIKYIITGTIILYLINKILYFFSLGLNYSKLTSGRLGNWQEVIQRLNERDSIFTGLGYVNSNTFYNSDLTANLLTDNWFIHTLAMQGILGLLLGILLIFIILLVLYKNGKRNYSDENNYFKSFTFLILIYSTVENMFFNVNYILTMFYWIAIFTYLFKCTDIENYIRRKKNEQKI
ncbi:hypothetical protein AB8J22_000900 [Clostridium perfringens]